MATFGIARLTRIARAVYLARSIASLSTAERGIANDARAIYNAKVFGQIRSAHAAGQATEVGVNGVTILYEPKLPTQGMTLFGSNSFVIGPAAFSSESELAKTVAHESYRLAMSTSSGGGVDAALAKAETDAAFNFAEQVGPYVMGGP